MQRPLKAFQDGFWSHANRRGLFLFPARRLPGRNPPPVDDIRFALGAVRRTNDAPLFAGCVCAAERRPRFCTSPVLAEIYRCFACFDQKLTYCKPPGLPGGFLRLFSDASRGNFFQSLQWEHRKLQFCYKLVFCKKASGIFRESMICFP